jgi:methyl-accepting chemotaxis protein
VQSSTDQAANVILGIGNTIGEISQIAAAIAAAVEEQGSATEGTARNVDQAAQGTTEVTRNISGVNRTAETSSASANQVLLSATELAQQSERGPGLLAPVDQRIGRRRHSIRCLCLGKCMSNGLKRTQ